MTAVPGRDGWALAPGVLRLRGDRLAGGTPFRVVRLSPTGHRDLVSLLGTSGDAPPSLVALTRQLVGYGLLLTPPLLGAPDASDLAAVTVVIPARSGPAPVQAVLDAVPGRVQVVLVDDGSPTPLAAVIRARPGLRHLRHDVARGPAAARNAGAALATTDWVAFVDADLDLPDRWLARLLGAALADPGVVAVGPRIRSTASPGLGGLVEEHAGGLDLGAVPGDVVVGGPVGYLPSAVLLVDRSAFVRVGGFDEALHVAEDVDLVWRLLDEGTVRYRPDVVVPHAPRASLAAVLRRRRFYGTGAARLDVRHPGTVRHADVSVWSFVPWVLGVAVHPALGALAAAVTIGAAPRTFPALPARTAARLAWHGQVTAFVSLGRYAIRPMWPVTVALAVVDRRRRRVLGAVLLAGVADIVRRRRRDTAPGATVWPVVVVAHLLDDLAYSLGVWDGCVRTRRVAPLLPRVRFGRTARGTGGPGRAGRRHGARSGTITG